MVTLALSSPAIASATGMDASSSTTTPCLDDSGNPCVPLACDGALCDTTNGASCGVVSGAHSGGSLSIIMMLGAAAALIAIRGRRRRALAASCITTIIASTSARAEPKPVDVVIHDAQPASRLVTLEWNPLPLAAIGKLTFIGVIMPAEHHGIVVSPYYAEATTAPIYIFDDAGHATQLPRQRFRGFGGELGYRYYFGQAGPRGFFLGPSATIGGFTATTANGTDTHYLRFGGAADVGFQALLGDQVSITFGGGVEISGTDKDIPKQQFPASFYANFAVIPRLLLAVGWAF
jgi:hypothetical protein